MLESFKQNTPAPAPQGEAVKPGGPVLGWRITGLGKHYERDAKGTLVCYRGPNADGTPRTDGSQSIIFLTEAQARSQAFKHLRLVPFLNEEDMKL